MLVESMPVLFLKIQVWSGESVSPERTGKEMGQKGHVLISSVSVPILWEDTSRSAAHNGQDKAEAHVSRIYFGRRKKK